MRKIILILVFMTTVSCGSNSATQKSQKYYKTEDFSFVKPNKWRKVYHHGYYSYTPIRDGENFYQNKVTLRKIKPKPDVSFGEFCGKQINGMNKGLNITDQEITQDKNRFGEVFIHTYEVTSSYNVQKTYMLFFQHNKEFYYFKYDSNEDNYEKYFDQANSILTSLKFQ